jgi:hypothetical protein
MLRIAPGGTVWTTAAMVVETLNVLLSARCSVPFFVPFRLGDVASEKVNGWGGFSAFPEQQAGLPALCLERSRGRSAVSLQTSRPKRQSLRQGLKEAYEQTNRSPTGC